MSNIASRRHRGDGSITQRGTSWEVRLWIPTDPGNPVSKPRRISRRAHSEREARSILAALRREAAVPQQAEILRTSSRDTVAGFVPVWRAALDAEVLDGHLRPKSAADAVALVQRHVVPVLGQTKLSEVRPSGVKALSAALAAAGYSDNTRRLVVAAFRRMLRAAADDNQFPRSMLTAITAPKVRRQPVRATPDNQGVRALIVTLTADADNGSGPATLCLLALATGARRGEVAGCRWRDVDLVRASWRVSTSVTIVGRELHEAPPKTDQERSVPLPPFMMDVLRSARRARPFAEFVGGEDLPHPDCIGAHYRKRAKALGLPTGMHGARRYLASAVLSQSKDLDLAARLLGHSGIAVLRRYYLIDRDEAVADAVTAVFA